MPATLAAMAVNRLTGNWSFHLPAQRLCVCRGPPGGGGGGGDGAGMTLLLIPYAVLAHA